MKRFLSQNAGINSGAAGPTSLTLADKMRPSSLDDYFGQEELIAPGALLRSLFDKDAVPSMILWVKINFNKLNSLNDSCS
jgi:replication-associated recombination protein RarA